MKIDQPTLGKRGILLLLIMLAAFPPLTMDLYLPALPQMAENFDTHHSMINWTLASYMIAFSLGMLFWGPLSERTGRKPLLLIALSIYIIASILCAMASNVESLIIWRILQGLAGGGVTVIDTTIVKDLFDGREREKVMATVMSLVIIAPIIAPVLGAFLLKIATWHMMFIALALFGCIASVLAICYHETLEEKSTGSLFKTWSRLGTVLKNPSFAYLLFIFMLIPMCLMSFIGIAAYVYIDVFGLSEQTFSFVFAANAIFAMIAPSLYIKLSHNISVQNIILSCFALIISAGMMMLFFGEYSLWLFAAISALVTSAVIIVRVPGANLMLEQQTRDTGSAAALIQFSASMMGAIGIQIVSLSGSIHLIRNYGCLLIVIGIICATLWYRVRNKPFVTDKLSKTVPD